MSYCKNCQKHVTEKCDCYSERASGYPKKSVESYIAMQNQFKGRFMADKYRKLSDAELASYGIKQNTSQNTFIKSVKECFGEAATRVLAGFNSEYNDETYSVHGFSYVEVYDSQENMMVPLKNKVAAWRTVLNGGVAHNLVNKNGDSELYDAPSDMIIYLKVPELYIKEA